MTSHKMPPPGLAFTALTPNCKREPGEYEKRLMLLSVAALLAEYEAVINSFMSGQPSEYPKVVEARREVARRMAS